MTAPSCTCGAATTAAECLPRMNIVPFAVTVTAHDLTPMWTQTKTASGAVRTLGIVRTAQLVGVKLLPIYWLPRKHVLTNELAIVLLSAGHKYGGGFRRCAGEYVARELVRLVLQRWRFELVSEESDLRPVGLITQRLRRVVGTLTKREDVL